MCFAPTTRARPSLPSHVAARVVRVHVRLEPPRLLGRLPPPPRRPPRGRAAARAPRPGTTATRRDDDGVVPSSVVALAHHRVRDRARREPRPRDRAPRRGHLQRQGRDARGPPLRAPARPLPLDRLGRRRGRRAIPRRRDDPGLRARVRRAVQVRRPSGPPDRRVLPGRPRVRGAPAGGILGVARQGARDGAQGGVARPARHGAVERVREVRGRREARARCRVSRRWGAPKRSFDRTFDRTRLGLGRDRHARRLVRRAPPRGRDRRRRGGDPEDARDRAVDGAGAIVRRVLRRPVPIRLTRGSEGGAPDRRPPAPDRPLGGRAVRDVSALVRARPGAERKVLPPVSARRREGFGNRSVSAKRVVRIERIARRHPPRGRSSRRGCSRRWGSRAWASRAGSRRCTTTWSARGRWRERSCRTRF